MKKFTKYFLFILSISNSFGQNKCNLKFNIGVVTQKYEWAYRNPQMPNYRTIPLVGLEFKINKLKTSLELRKVVWLSAAGGHPRYTFDGYEESILQGANYYLELKKKQTIKFSLFHSFTRIFEFNSLPVSLNPKTGLRMYQIRSINFLLSYALTKRLFLETNFIYFYKTYLSEIPVGINKNRIQLGLTYSFIPLKKTRSRL